MGARARPDKGESERTCIVTGKKGPPEAMIHFSLSPSGEVAPDLRRKLRWEREQDADEGGNSVPPSRKCKYDPNGGNHVRE